MSGYNIDRFVNLSETERDELTCNRGCDEVLKLENLTQHTVDAAELSKHLKQQLEYEFGDHWHVIAGKKYEFGSNCTCETGHFLSVEFDKLFIVMYMTHDSYYDSFKRSMLSDAKKIVLDAIAKQDSWDKMITKWPTVEGW
ncbi:unnamed protein product [Oppiella nova]|uniref:Dynein light chain n=1 Tax=Oppiella nova TaxID=334625 RepID=A0A7R9MHX6_9ACAR|nr:unnamed protein product [Oppiella nova]CAG2177710.1 unnamed protein product [Oppiella nova]